MVNFEETGIVRLGELFCGAGGMALGAIRARGKINTRLRFEHAWANDYDFDACATYSKNIGGVDKDSVICKDVRQLDFHTLSEIDCLAFGFPCNDFSVVGEQKGFDGNFGPLYEYGAKALDFFRPSCFVAENVGGIQSANDGNAFSTILNRLSEAGPGYSVTSHLYKAEEYGVPQRRRRVLIVGIANWIGRNSIVPSPTTKLRPPTVRNAIADFPIPEGSFNHELPVQGKTVTERLKFIRPGQNAFNADMPESLRLKVKGAKISQIYRRLELDEPSYTVTGSGGGGTHIYHWEEDRALTNRERARLQGFPDSFVFLGSRSSVRKQIGMAVPPPLAEAVFSALLDSLSLDDAQIGINSVPVQLPLGLANRFEPAHK